jgi:hypothetical protein
MRKVFPILVVVLLLLLSVAPAAYAKPSEAIICNHVVKTGETIYCIARAYGVSPWAIASIPGRCWPYPMCICRSGAGRRVCGSVVVGLLRLLVPVLITTLSSPAIICIASLYTTA